MGLLLPLFQVVVVTIGLSCTPPPSPPPTDPDPDDDIIEVDNRPSSDELSDL